MCLTKRSNNNDECNYLINSCLEIVSHFTRMAQGCLAEKENIEAEHIKRVIQVCAMIAVYVDNIPADVLASS